MFILRAVGGLACLGRVLGDMGHLQVIWGASLSQELLHICICLAMLTDRTAATGRGLMHSADTSTQLHHGLQRKDALYELSRHTVQTLTAQISAPQPKASASCLAESSACCTRTPVQSAQDIKQVPVTKALSGVRRECAAGKLSLLGGLQA